MLFPKINYCSKIVFVFFDIVKVSKSDVNLQKNIFYINTTSLYFLCLRVFFRNCLFKINKKVCEIKLHVVSVYMMQKITKVVTNM
ncbi:hypothetical protein CMT77_16405 [Elizabethkingia anophelis]|nr:hypothetical protein [Elizabethkingia anophelis]